jgi:hypothetical protein
MNGGVQGILQAVDDVRLRERIIDNTAEYPRTDQGMDEKSYNQSTHFLISLRQSDTVTEE